MQMDIFDLLDCADVMEAIEPEPAQEKTPHLNGFYYESSTGLYVSYSSGKRHYETDGAGFPADWKKRIKTERRF